MTKWGAQAPSVRAGLATPIAMRAIAKPALKNYSSKNPGAPGVRTRQPRKSRVNHLADSLGRNPLPKAHAAGRGGGQCKNEDIGTQRGGDGNG